MSKQIEDLSKDIYALLQSQPKGTDEEIAERFASFGVNMGLLLERAMRERTAARKVDNVLWASELGKPCLRAVWYAHNTPTLAEKIPEHTKFKFLYGDVLEELVLTLAEQAGHEVSDRQKVHEAEFLNGWRVRGRQDATIDGVVVDVKSASQFGMRKFEAGLTDETDNFGYRAQVSFYNPGGTKRQGFVVVDKANGHVKYFDSPHINPIPLAEERINHIVLAREPGRIKDAEVPASYGNLKLGVECSYCPFKTTCFRKANKGKGLKAVFYSNGPVFLSHEKKTPNVAHQYFLTADPTTEKEVQRVYEERT